MLEKHHKELLQQPGPRELFPLFSFTRLDTANHISTLMTQIESLCAVCFHLSPGEGHGDQLNPCSGALPTQGPQGADLVIWR